MNSQLAQTLYSKLIRAWNTRNASAFADCFADDSICIGFDGSEMVGRMQIQTQLSQIFKDHTTAQYVAIIREDKMLSDNVALVRSHVGMIPSGGHKIDPGKNAIQVMVSRATEKGLAITLFQNTPAQYHGRPEVAEALTAELQNAADKENGLTEQ